ncbi:TPA: BC_2427 family protein [Bacillus cereus]|uniref:BC_2427 family protein n=1 Tax=Bacillus cereus TaxID=1396 RepID=UPI000A30298C|nr:hypothetical protein [Bacillus cereus]MBL3768736.1 hypothetical protein [Bacillus cereus]SMD60936.1 hypothetical protein BACERE00184_00174 [Bacillus cereus]HDR8089426.1 hypothetical protein [Bacillus cereus]HDR8207569.1 hypothetical protein [Bacillus cereus]HDR8211457.1 hypothetical protein [Bacillus cereus]
MKKPLVGKRIWNKFYKGEILNDQDDSREIRKNKKNEKKESEVKVIQTEKERKEPGSEKEVKVIQTEKERKEPESEKEVKVIQTEKERKEPRSKKEDKIIGLEKESEKNLLEKEAKANELDEVEVKIKSEKVDKTNESQKKSIDSESKIETSVRSIEVKTPFSIISDVTSFIKFPNINVKNQETFVFRSEKDARGRELDSKLLTTMQNYPEEINCNLVSSNLHEKRVLLELSNQKVKGNMEERWGGQSSWIPIHSMILEKDVEADVNNYITAKLPIEIGRYKGEISLIEKVVFKGKTIEIKEVSQEIILTKKEFLLPKIIKKEHNPSIIEKGSLCVEGYIFQCIEFISEQSKTHDKRYQLMQNIVLELTIQLLQEQEVLVRIT